METYIQQRDLYGNPVPGLYAFDIEVVEKGTNLLMTISDLRFKEVRLGVQFLSFNLDEPGEFILIISDKEQKNIVFGIPYEFTVSVGYWDGLNSIVNGYVLNHSVAGENFIVLWTSSYGIRRNKSMVNFITLNSASRVALASCRNAYVDMSMEMKEQGVSDDLLQLLKGH